MLYRPLYDVKATKGKYERHVLAVTHFSRWDSKFNPVKPSEVPFKIFMKALFSPPPVPMPQLIPVAKEAQVVPAQGCTKSGFGTRSLDPCLLEHILGDYHAFTDALIEALQKQLDVSKYQLDHICYRCATQDEYDMVLKALTVLYGKLLVEATVGGRPIATVLLHNPIRHAQYEIESIELAAPKPGVKTKSGLDFVGFAIGSPADGIYGNSVLKRFMAQHPTIKFNTRALEKDVSPDVSVEVTTPGEFGAISAKFHSRPLVEVVRIELEDAAKQGKQ
mmetsp:Transcript_8604/g.16892  ORF Transcript_8604/g.16892 Transcript_8604/m.16892 type:complete len:277 (+) Transcript_8604:2-832(+)